MEEEKKRRKEVKAGDVDVGTAQFCFQAGIVSHGFTDGDRRWAGHRAESTGQRLGLTAKGKGSSTQLRYSKLQNNSIGYLYTAETQRNPAA